VFPVRYELNSYILPTLCLCVRSAIVVKTELTLGGQH
jgi:hypothetical protein